MNARLASLVKVFVLALVFGFISHGWTAPVPEAMALQVARSWLASNQNSSASGRAAFYTSTVSSVSKVRPVSDCRGRVIAYACDVLPTGYIIVPGDDLVEPVIAFSDEGSFNATPGADNALLDMLLKDIPDRIDHRSGLQTANLASAIWSLKTRWNQLAGKVSDSTSATSIPDDQVTKVVWPLLGTGDHFSWDQGDPYNRKCPISILSFRSPTGCVATAMGMIIRYYRYPERVSFTNYRFNYDLMPDRLTQASTSQQIDQVSTLLAHCGSTVQMNYGLGSSGTDTAKVATALRLYWGYASAEWDSPGNLQDVISDLNHGDPVQMAITGSSRGHSIVCDGLGNSGNGDRVVHLNMGWSGYGNGWYFTPFESNPGSVGGYQWSILRGVVHNIRRPSASQPPPGDAGTPNAPSDLSPANGSVTTGRNIHFTWSDRGSSNGSACTSFNVKIRRTGSSSVLNLGWRAGTSRDWTSDGYGDYEWLVQAGNGTGRISNSAWAWFRVPGPPRPPLGIGDWALIQNSGTIGVKIRVAANGTDTGARLRDGDMIQIVDGPVLAGLYWWYRHDRGGWTAYSSRYSGSDYVYMSRTSPPVAPPIAVGDWILTQNTGGVLGVRDCPSGASAGTLADGLTLRLIGGPVYRSGIWWYQHEKGWSAYASTYRGVYSIYMQKTSPPSQPPIAAGDWVITKDTGGIYRVRSGPDGDDTGKRLQDGLILRIVDGPVLAGGLWWYRHDSGGWSAYSSTYQGTVYVYMAKTASPEMPPLRPGDSAMTKNTLGALRVRTSPNGQDTGWRLQDYVTLTIMAGPEFVGGQWWYGFTCVDRGTPVSGWAAYMVDGDVLMVKIDTSRPPLDPGDDAVTQNVVVNGQPYLRVRSDHSLSATTYGRIGDNVPLRITDGPVFQDGIWWYRHENPVLSGWSAYRQDETYMRLVPPPVPAMPSDLRADTTSPNTLTLRWSDNSSDEQGFKIELRMNDGFVEIGSVATNTTEYSMVDLEAGTSYRFRVCAGNKGGASGYSNETDVTMPLIPPASPSELRATSVAPGSIELSWQDCSTDEEGFVVERRAADGEFVQIGTVDADNRQYTDSDGISGSTVYSYRIRAYNAGGYSEYTQDGDAAALDLMAAPEMLSSTEVTPDSVTLAWVDMSDCETGYRVERRLGDHAYEIITELESNTTSFVDTGLLPSTRYVYRILACGDGVESNHTNELEIDTLPPVPQKPTGLTSAQTSTRSITLRWNPSGTDENGFYVERRLAGGEYIQIATVDAGLTGYEDTGLYGGNDLTYRVRAFNGSGCSEYSNETPQSLSPSVSIDAAMGTGESGGFVGIGVLYPALQVAQTLISENSAVFHARVSNDGNMDQRVSIRTREHGQGQTVRYLDDQTGTDITAEIVTTDGMPLYMTAGAVYDIRIEEAFDPATTDARCHVLLEVNSVEGSTSDQVWALASSNTSAPVLSTTRITSPTTDDMCVTTTQSLLIAGDSFDDIGVTRVDWSSDRGGSGVCSGTSNWSASIALQPGTNHITVTANGILQNSSSDSLLAFYSPDTPVSILDAKALADSSSVYLAGKAVTAVLDNRIYLEERSRQSGVAFIPINPPVGIMVGDLVDVAGDILTDENGERYILGAMNTLIGTHDIRPFGMLSAFLGGSDWHYADGTGQKGVLGGRGPNNIGLLVRTWGKAIFLDEHAFEIDDGSDRHIRVLTPVDVIVDPRWSYVSVTGVSSCEKNGNETYPLVRVRMRSDIVNH